MDTGVPVIDLSAGTEPVIDQLAAATARFGFFQIVGHGIDGELIAEVWRQTRAFFASPREAKLSIERTKENTRGYYDRELTKNARDLKEVLDLAQVPHPDLPADDPTNFHAVDGFNQWPDLDGFRPTMLAYLTACERLSLRVVRALTVGLGEDENALIGHFGSDHTSFVRLNYYPLADPLPPEEAAAITELGDMALHHHSDAGAVTVLLQDEVGGLQVEHDGRWIEVTPIEGALVVNGGDMFQVWSNDRYRAALHRVRPMTTEPRYSLPYFFNPSYTTDYSPLPGAVKRGDEPHYRPINWGDFRQARADGDYADYGAEIQITDFLTDAGGARR